MTLLKELLEGQELNEREVETLQYAADGYTATETGLKIFLSEETIKSYRKRIIAKFGAKNLAECIAIGMRRGLIK